MRPRSHFCVPAEPERASARLAHDGKRRVRRRMKIMIVENDSLLALALEEQLRLAGHEIVGPLYDYGEALMRARDERPSVAIVDVEISNAEERTKLVWSLSGLLDIPSIVLTSRIQSVIKCEGAAAAIVQKPFQPEDVLPVVDSAIGRRAASARESTRRLHALRAREPRVSQTGAHLELSDR